MKRRNFAAILLFLIISFVISVGLFVYYQNLSERLYASTKNTLIEVATQQKFNLDSEIQAEKSLLHSIAASLAYMPGDEETACKMLSDIIGLTKFDYITLTDIDGEGITQDGIKVNISDRPYFGRLLSGETVLWKPMQSRVRDAIVIPLATPIWIDGKMEGMLVGTYTTDKMSEILLPSFEGKGYAFVIDNTGEIMIGTKNDYTVTTTNNLFDSWYGITFNDGQNYADVVKEIQSGAVGFVHYTIKGQERLAAYMPVNNNDWCIVVAVPLEVISAETSAITKSTIIMSSVVALSFALVFAFVLWQQHKNVKALEKVAYFDELTGGPTLVRFKMEAQRFIDDNPNKKLLMVKFDIDRFKLVNQILGYDVGDSVIINLAKALMLVTPGKYERYARLHDDEFLVLHTYEREEELVEIRDRYQSIFRELMGEGFRYDVRLISGHYYMSAENCHDVSEAIEKANIAHNKAKQEGLEVCVYDNEIIDESLKHKDIENRMKPALENREFRVYLQAKYFLADETMAGAEALVRWRRADGTMIPPNQFIPLFEKNGFITRLDMYMMESVCEKIREWIDTGKPAITVSVNFSRLHLTNPDFVSQLSNIADKYGVPKKYIEIELTETTIFDNETALEVLLNQLHDAGFTLSMDDFGTGYSSLGLLKNLPVDVIKIDRSFFVGDKYKTRARTVISSVMEMSRKLGIHTVAEGVEEQEHIDFLRAVGCDIVQGYYYARPIPAEEFDPNALPINLHK